MIYRRINVATGQFIEDVITDNPTADLIATPCPAGFYWPKWDGAKWVEGKTAAEIAPILEAKTLATTSDNNRASIADAALNALAINKTYIERVSPTAAQTTTEVKMLAQQMNGVIRLLLNKLDATD